MEKNDFWFLENIDVTAILCPVKQADAEFMSRHLQKKFRKGESIYVEKELSDRIFFIAEGRVKIATQNEEGKEITKAILQKGEVFGEMSLLGESQRADYAVAMEPTECCIVSLPELRGLMIDRTDLWQFFMKIFARRKLEMEQRLVSLVFRDSRSRIVEFLVNLTREKGQRVGYEWVVRSFITHQEIANLTATSRQTVTTTLNDLRYKKLLTFNRNRLLIRDLGLLEKEIRLAVAANAIH